MSAYSPRDCWARLDAGLHAPGRVLDVGVGTGMWIDVVRDGAPA